MIRFTALFLLFPLLAFAAPRDFKGLVELFIELINIAIPVVIAFALLGFLWGIARYLFSVSDSAKLEEGRKAILWGLIALFVAVSIWGILRVLAQTFL